MKMKARFLVIGWQPPDVASIVRDRVTADIGEDVEPPTDKELQRLMFVVKREFRNLIWKRERAKKKKKKSP